MRHSIHVHSLITFLAVTHLCECSGGVSGVLISVWVWMGVLLEANRPKKHFAVVILRRNALWFCIPCDEKDLSSGEFICVLQGGFTLLWIIFSLVLMSLYDLHKNVWLFFFLQLFLMPYWLRHNVWMLITLALAQQNYCVWVAKSVRCRNKCNLGVWTMPNFTVITLQVLVLQSYKKITLSLCVLQSAVFKKIIL